MLHDRRQRHVERCGKLGDGGGSMGEALDHAAPARVGQRVERQIEAFRILKHSLKYSFRELARQGEGMASGDQPKPRTSPRPTRARE